MYTRWTSRRSRRPTLPGDFHDGFDIGKSWHLRLERCVNESEPSTVPLSSQSPTVTRRPKTVDSILIRMGRALHG